MADPEPPAPIPAPAAANGDLGAKFDKMIELMQHQNELIADQGKTLKSHSTMLETLKTDALKNDQAMEGRSLRDRLTWNVLRKEATAKTKEKVDEWKDLMQLSLVFNAIFLTVVTAFIAPVIQAFTSTPTNSTSDSSSKPPLPPLSTQFVALFFYLALIVSILNAVLCVLGMQWASRLLAIPVGKDDLERTLAHEKRRALAEGKLLPLMGVLFWTLLLSIGFFIVGLLIQVWALSFACSKPSFVLVVAAAISTGLSVIILGVILSTTYHAAITESSPFESPLSAAMRPALQWFRLHILRKDAPTTSATDKGAAHSQKKSVDELIQMEEKDTDNLKALKTYARLVLNTTDAEVLERAVPSFEIGEWYDARDTLWDVFLAVRERFLATDTSFRVKETVHKQLVYCREWSGWKGWLGRWRSDVEGNVITRFCRDQCSDLVRGSHESHRQFFSSWVFFTSLDPDNRDLRGDPDDSYETSVARVLSSFDQNGKLGNRFDVFRSAVDECDSLLRDGRSDDVIFILSHCDRSSIIRSLLRNPHMEWLEIRDIVAYITRGNEVAVLEEMAKFFSNLPDMKLVFGDLLVIEFLGSLVPSLPSTFTLPRSFDLAPVLTLRLRSYDFFQLCLELLSDDNIQNTKIRDRAKFYLEPHWGLIALPPPSPQELQDLVDALHSYQDNMACEDLEKSFVDAVKQCDSLCLEGRRDELTLILSHVDRVSLLGLILRNPHFCGRHISALMPLTIEGNEPEHIRAAPVVLASIPPMSPSDGDLPIIAFLAFLIPLLPSKYVVPPDFDLSQALTPFIRYAPDQRTWRKNSDTLMHYLHRGAFNVLSDQDSVRKFLDTCIRPFRWMRDWNQDQRTSALTHERAVELQKKLDVLDPAAAPSISSPIIEDRPAALDPEETVQPRAVVLRTRDAFRRRLGDIWSRNWIGRTADVAGDVEMAMTSRWISEIPKRFSIKRVMILTLAEKMLIIAGIAITRHPNRPRFFVATRHDFKLEAGSPDLERTFLDFQSLIQLMASTFSPLIMNETSTSLTGGLIASTISCSYSHTLNPSSSSPLPHPPRPSSSPIVSGHLPPTSLEMADLEPQVIVTTKDGSSSSIGDLGSKFDVMIDLMKSHIAIVTEQSKTQTEQSQLLRHHSKMLEALEKDATRGIVQLFISVARQLTDKVVDDKAYEGRGLKAESTWGALDKEALAKIKVLVDGWKDLMNVSLIFIALFLTVVTAFISPIIQSFSTPSSANSSPSSKPPPPSTSLQLVTLFYYLALTFSIFNSVMCVLGMQWASKLLSVPLGKTNLQRTLNRERRKLLAEQRLLPLMSVLFWTLLLSIGFFVIGFLIQFWDLSFSFDEHASILIFGAVAATALAITILGVILATTYHATVHANSPFESPLSSASIATWAWLKRVMRKPERENKKAKGGAQRWYHHVFTIKLLNRFHRRLQSFAPWFLVHPPLSPEPASHELWEEERDTGRFFQDEDERKKKEYTPIEILMQENEDDRETVQALKAYARLVINTNDTEVLERAVPSFEIGEWCKSGGELLLIFLAVRERFLATDTSFRVKETVNKQLVYCRQWSGWRNEYERWRWDLEGNAITRWCRDQCNDLARGSHESHRQFFSAWVFFKSFDPHNRDLRGSPWGDSYEESVALVLSSFDQKGKLGDRRDVFCSAVEECISLLHDGRPDGRPDDVTRILSRGDRASLLRSLLRNQICAWGVIKDIIGLTTRGKEVAVLEELASFLSVLPGVKSLGWDLLVIDFLGSLIPSLPSTFTVPQSFDLAPTLSLFLHYRSTIRISLLHYSDTLIYFLDHGGFEGLSSLWPAHDFFQLCLTLSSDGTPQSMNRRDRAKFYLEPHRGLV
ncbi:hypothetical protein SISNIDRAFT_543898, partial [Sistotremastrum niveocremeum HHB9708]